jgi:hypothetical protein
MAQSNHSIIRYCTDPFACIPYASPCKSIKDCKPTSECIVVDLDVVDSNIPGRALPEAHMELCRTRSTYCLYDRCVVTDPSWRDYTDKMAIQTFRLNVNSFASSQQH